MPVPQSQTISLEMVLKARNEASAAINEVGRELAAVGKDTSIGNFAARMRESLAEVNAQLRQDAGERVKLARQTAADELHAARSERSQMVREAKAHFEELARVAEEASAKERARAQADAQRTLSNAIFAHQKQTQEAQEFLDKETGQLARAAEERAKILGGLTLSSYKGGETTPRWRGEGGRYAKSTLSIDEQRAIATAIQADEALAKAHQSTYKTMVGDAHDAYRAIANATEEGLERQLADEESALAKQRLLLSENRRLELEGVEELYRGWTGISKEGLSQVQSITAASLQKDIAQQRSYGTAAISEQRRLAQDQERIARQLARDEQRIARERQAKSRETGIIGHGIEGLGNIVQQSLIWNAAYQVAGKIEGTIGAMASGMLSVNVQLEQFQATFSSIYQNKDKGVQAVKWLTDLAVQLPATREETIQAGLTIASLGDNIKEVMLPLANIASVMHVELPRAAQAFADAQEGRFQMLQTTLHITKAELKDYGLVLDGNNRVLNNSFIPAFEKLGRVRFAGAAADQMKTLGGAASNLVDAFANLQATLGHGIFKALEDNLGKLLVMLKNPALEHFAGVLGGQMGRALSSVIGNIDKWIRQMGGIPGLVGHIGTVVHGASQVFMGLWGALSNVGFVIKTVSDLISPLLGLIAKLSGAADTDSGRLRILVQVATDLFIAYKVLGPIIGLVTGAMEKQKIATVAATEAEVVCKTATMDLAVVLGEEGLTAVAGTCGNAITGVAGGMTTAGTAAGRLGGVLGGLKGIISSSMGQMILFAADIGLVTAAWNQLQTNLRSGQQKQQLLDYGKELTPIKGTETTLGHLLWQGPASGQGGAAYIAYTNMIAGRNAEDRAGGTKAFLDALQSDPALMQTYMRFMTGQRSGARVRQVLSGYTGMASTGGGLVNAQQQQDAQNYQAYQSALNMFNAELRTRPADAATQMGVVVQAYQTWKLGSQTSQAADEAALGAANQLQSQLNARLPAQYRLGSGTGDLSQKGEQRTSPTDKLAAAKKALAQFRAHQWADTLHKIGLGTIDQTDVQSVIDQLKEDERAAGVVVSDTDIMNRVRAATKTYVAALGRRFAVIMGQLRDHHKGITADMARAVLNRIQQSELAVGLDDTTGLQQQRLERFTAPAGSGGPIMAGSAAAEQVGYLRTSLGDAKAHLAALAKKTPGATQAIEDLINQIAGPGGLVEQYDRARNVPWPQTLKDEDAARTHLTSLYLGAHKASHALADAHSQLAIDLKGLGDSSKDYKTLLADATRIHKDDLAKTHSKTHAEAAYQQALGQVNAHMTGIARSRLKDDLLSLGTSAADHKRLLDDLNALYADEKRQYPHSKQAHADYEANLKLINKHMKGETAAGGVQVPTPLYGPYRIATAQYGATQVSFGGTQQSNMAALVQHLKELVSYWQARAHRDEDALRAQQQIAASSKETAVNTANLPERLARVTGSLGLAPAPAGGAGAGMRARGGFAVVRRV